MRIFYGQSAGRPDVPADAPVDSTPAATLQIFRDLKPGQGFLSMPLDDRFVVNLLSKRNRCIRVELLDTSTPAFDACDTSPEFAEYLIHAAAAGQDVFQVARGASGHWEHWDLSTGK